MPKFIEAKDLRKVYGSGDIQTVALDHATLSIDQGEFIAIMGPSGSGKSTLLHILGMLDHQTSGTYVFNGKTIDQYDEEAIAQIRNTEVGFVFQAFNLLPRTTVAENVILPLIYSDVPEKDWDERVQKAIDAVNLSHRSDHESAQLSGGEKQRVAIARALINNPDVIMADEPTGNLDTASGEDVMDIISDLNKQGKTVIVITHEEEIAAYAKRVIHMRDGRIERDEVVKK